VLAQDEDFERVSAIPNVHSDRFGNYTGETIYDEGFAGEVDFKTYPDLVHGFFYFPAEDGDFQPATDSDFMTHLK
jgi:hypothetical protein